MVVMGTLLVWFTMLLAVRLFDQPWAGVLSGLWAAANPGLIHYSVNSMPEIGFAACMVGAYAMAADTLRGRAVKHCGLLAGFSLLGFGIYFKPLDTLTAFALIAGWTFLVYIRRLRQIWLPLLGGVALFVVVVGPHFVLQQTAPEEGALNVGLVNRSGALVKGHRAYDSRYEYGTAVDPSYAKEVEELRDLGIAKWIWNNRGDIAQRYAQNVLTSFRIYGGYIFANGFRIGNAWFGLMLAGVFLLGVLRSYRLPILYLFLAAFAFPLGVSLSYVFDRWLVVYVPLFIVILVGHVVTSPSFWQAAWRKGIWLFVVLAMAANSINAMARQLRDDAWCWDNQKEVANWLRDVAYDGSRIMSGRPTLVLELDLEHPYRWVQLPPLSIQDTEALAGRGGVSYVVLSDTFYPHWPVNQIIKGDAAPLNWVLLADRKFERIHPVRGEQQDHYQIYKRLDPVTSITGSAPASVP